MYSNWVLQIEFCPGILMGPSSFEYKSEKITMKAHNVLTNSSYYIILSLIVPIFEKQFNKHYDGKDREEGNHDEETQLLCIKTAFAEPFHWQFQCGSSGKPHFCAIVSRQDHC